MPSRRGGSGPARLGTGFRRPGRPVPGSWLRLRVVLPICALIIGSATEAHSQTVPLPADLQVALLTSILTFDRNLRSRSGEEVVIGVVFQNGFPTSRTTAREMERAFYAAGIRAVGDISIRIVLIPLAEVEGLPGQLRDQGVNLVYVAPLRAMEIRRILAATREAGALTITGVPDYVGEGVAVGLGIREGRPRIFINLPAARGEGADFASNLLQLAEVVR